MSDGVWEQIQNLVAKFWWIGLIIVLGINFGVIGAKWWKKVNIDSRDTIKEVPPRYLRGFCQNPTRGGVAIRIDDSTDSDSSQERGSVLSSRSPSPAAGSISEDPNMGIPLQEIVSQPNPSDTQNLPNRDDDSHSRRSTEDFRSTASGETPPSHQASGEGFQSAGSSGQTPDSRESSGKDYESAASEHKAVYRGKSAKITDWPFLVAVGPQRWPGNWLAPLRTGLKTMQPETLCTGIIVAPTWVITAGHCVKHFTSRYYVTAGTDCRPEYGGIHETHARRVRVSRVERFYVRGLTISFKRWLPKWESIGTKAIDRAYVKTDIALLRLEEPIYQIGSENTHIGPISLESPQGLDLFSQGDAITMKQAGWGATRYASFPERLKEYTLQPPTESVLMSPEQDVHHFGAMEPYWSTDCLNASPLLCTKTAPDQPQASSGDSGGPLIAISSNPEQRKTLVGVVSGGAPLFRHEPQSQLGETPEEDEPEQPPRSTKERGVRPGIGNGDVVIHLRVKDKRLWIQQVINGIPVWKRLLNGTSLLIRCLWYCLIAWWLDWLKLVWLAVLMVIRIIRLNRNQPEE